jgi:tryptophan synthase alpha chain
VSTIESVFAAPGHKALITYLTVGYPDIETTLKVAPILESCGCDLIELGIPFSDPLADGTTIQQASCHSLSHGTTPAKCLEVADSLRAKASIPLVFMTYYNPIHSYGVGAFCQDCENVGVSGLIVPDLPPEESDELEDRARSHSVDVIYLLAPTSTEERVREVAARSRGFIYLVSLTGVTGARENLPSELEDFVRRVRQHTTTPLCVGFGISTPEQARRVAQVADGVIIGSRLMQLLGEEDPLPKVEAFAGSLRSAISDGSRR